MKRIILILITCAFTLPAFSVPRAPNQSPVKDIVNNIGWANYCINGGRSYSIMFTVEIGSHADKKDIPSQIESVAQIPVGEGTVIDGKYKFYSIPHNLHSVYVSRINILRALLGEYSYVNGFKISCGIPEGAVSEGN